MVIHYKKLSSKSQNPLKNEPEDMPEIFSIKHDQTLGLAPIFRPLQRGERSSGKLDVRIKELESDIRITCFEPLGVDDQLILFSILSLCTEIDRSLVLSSEPQTEVGIALRADLFIRESNKKDSLGYCAQFTDKFHENYFSYIIHIDSGLESNVSAYHRRSVPSSHAFASTLQLGVASENGK